MTDHESAVADLPLIPPPIAPPHPVQPSAPAGARPVGDAGSGGSGLLARVLRIARGIDPVLARGTIWSFVVTAAGMGLGFATQVLLARVVGSHEYGTYLYVLGWTNVAGLLCSFELAGAAVRYVSQYRAAREWPLLRGFVRRSQQIVVVSAIVVAIGTMVVARLVPSMPRAYLATVAVACVLFPVNALLQLESGVLQGLKRVVAAQAPSLVLRPVLFGAGLLIASFAFRGQIGAAGAVGCQLVATAIALGATFRYMRRSLPAESRSAAPRYAMGEWMRTSAHFIGISLSQQVLSAQTDVLIVGTFLGATQAGLYGAASQFAVLVSFGATAAVFIAQPMIADLYARRRADDLQRLVSQVVMIAFAVSVPVFAGLLLFGHWLLGLYGAQFAQAYPVLLVLAGAQLVQATVGILLGYLLTMTAHQKEAARIIATTAVLNLAITAVLTPAFGVVGTATATLIAMACRSIALIVYARKLLGVRVVPRFGR